MRPDNDYARRAVSHLRRKDPVLARIIERVGPCSFRPDHRTAPFAALVESIVYQQITGRAAASIHRRVRALAAGRRLRPRDVLGATDAALRACGLSRQKISYLRDLAAHASAGGGLRGLGRLEDEAVVEALTAVRGIGRWTAEMFLIFRLGRLDVLPVHDYGIRKAMQRAWRLPALPAPPWMRRRAERWRPYRTIACWYLWRMLDAPGGRAAGG